MDWFAILGWLLATGIGIGWWIEHRGVTGIKSDLANAKREIQARVKK